MHYAKRPSPVVCALAGSVCTLGLIGIVARALDNFTDYTLHPALDVPSFVIGFGCTLGGGVWIGWLIIRGLIGTIRSQREEIKQLRAERATFDELLAAVKAADSQGEVNGVRLNKVLKILEQRNIDAPTQVIGKLHSITGGGGA